MIIPDAMNDEATDIQASQPQEPQQQPTPAPNQTPPQKGGNKVLLLILLGVLIAAAAVVATLFATGKLGGSEDDEDDEDDIEMDDRGESRRERRQRRDTIEYDTRSSATPVQEEMANTMEVVEQVDITEKHSDYNLDSRLLTDNELLQMSKAELRLLRNEIYARHGYIFQSKDLREYFSRQSWYYGHITNQNDVPLNTTERKNVELIKRYE